MFETYLGLAPGEAPIDRLIDDALPDPAFADLAATSSSSDDAPPPALWRRLLTRWTLAGTAAPHV